jgi:hypothetical protein
MLFGLCNVLATFQKVITNAFKNYFEWLYASILGWFQCLL